MAETEETRPAGAGKDGEEQPHPDSWGAVKSVADWTVIPMWDGFTQTLVFGFAKYLGMKVISSL